MLHVALFFLQPPYPTSRSLMLLFSSLPCDIEVMSLWYIEITVGFLSSSVHEKLSSFLCVKKRLSQAGKYI